MAKTKASKTVPADASPSGSEQPATATPSPSAKAGQQPPKAKREANNIRRYGVD